MNKEIFIDESILLCLYSQNSYKKEVISKIITFLKKGMVPISNMYVILKVKEIFKNHSNLEDFYLFLKNLNSILQKIYPLDWNDYKDSFFYEFNFPLQEPLSYYLYFMEKNHIQSYLSFRNHSKMKDIFLKFNIQFFTIHIDL